MNRYFTQDYDRHAAALDSLLAICVIRARMRGEIERGYVDDGTVWFTTKSAEFFRAMRNKVLAILQNPPEETQKTILILRDRLNRDRQRVWEMEIGLQIPHPVTKPSGRKGCRGRKPRTHRDY